VHAKIDCCTGTSTVYEMDRKERILRNRHTTTAPRSLNWLGMDRSCKDPAETAIIEQGRSHHYGIMGGPRLDSHQLLLQAVVCHVI
jgi:hypothetical protein